MRYGIAMMFFCCCLNVVAQPSGNYVFRHISQSDGLLHTGVRSIVQDAKGYIWILTSNGLQRYDGYQFVNYPFDLNIPNRISDAGNLNLFADNKSNVLWLTSTEIEKLDLKNNSFTLYSHDKIVNDSSFAFDEYKDAGGNKWLAGPFGFLYYNDTEKKMLPYYFAPVSFSPFKSHFYFTDTKKDEIWMADWEGLSLFESTTKQKYTHAYNPLHNPLLQAMGNIHLSNIFKDSRENIWMSTGSDSFFKYNPNSKKLSAYSLAAIKGLSKAASHDEHTLIVKCFFEDNHHNLWIGTANCGLLQYNREKDVFVSTISNEKNKQGLHYNYEITCIFQDKEDNIWLGTDKGINIFNPYHQYFQSIQHDENNAAASLPKNEIMNFIQAVNGNILAGTWGGGITVYDSTWNFTRNIHFPGPYEHNLVWSFVQNDDGNIWAGCQHGFIHLYNPSTGAIQTIHPPELNNQTIWAMTKDKKGNIWLGLHDGKIAKWDKQLNKFFAYNDHAGGIPQIYAHIVNIFFDSKDCCWVSTVNGFKEFDTDKRIFSAVYKTGKINNSSISSNDCGGIEEYDDSTLLVGTVHGGLNFFNRYKKTFSHLTTAEGLPANTIHAIKKDNAGYVWLTTDYELYKFKPVDKKFIRLNIEPGTVNAEFNNTPFYTLKDGKWLAATATEMICFRPQNNIDLKKAVSKVELTGFKVFDSSIFIDSLVAINKPIELSYKQNFLTIGFALLNFSNLQQTNYYYRLEGVDKDWVNAGTKNFASYTNLEPGDYTFTVKADNGNEVSMPASFKIRIIPPFWKSPLFMVSCLLGAGILIYCLFKRRIKTIRTEAGMKQKIAETEMMALRAQMNPHFIFNALNSIDNLIQMNEKEKATLYLAKFAKLIRLILENSKSSIVPCWKDLDTLQLYLELEAFRCDNKFSCELNIANEILNGDYKVPPLVIQPFVENAIHHGLLNKMEADKKLSVTVTAHDNTIYYCIEDNGIGRAKAAAYKDINKPAYESMGMQITAERINLFNHQKNGSVKITDMVDENGFPTGTKVEVMLINQV